MPDRITIEIIIIINYSRRDNLF